MIVRSLVVSLAKSFYFTWLQFTQMMKMSCTWDSRVSSVTFSVEMNLPENCVKVTCVYGVLSHLPNNFPKNKMFCWADQRQHVISPSRECQTHSEGFGFMPSLHSLSSSWSTALSTLSVYVLWSTQPLIISFPGRLVDLSDQMESSLLKMTVYNSHCVGFSLMPHNILLPLKKKNKSDLTPLKNSLSVCHGIRAALLCGVQLVSVWHTVGERERNCAVSDTRSGNIS